MDDFMEDQKARWEVPASLTRSALASYQDEAKDTNGRCLLKIDDLQKELETVKAELELVKNSSHTVAQKQEDLGSRRKYLIEMDAKSEVPPKEVREDPLVRTPVVRITLLVILILIAAGGRTCRRL